jgi:hypothetical protein
MDKQMEKSRDHVPEKNRKNSRGAAFSNLIEVDDTRIKGSITIIYDPDTDQAHLIPERGKIDKTVQVMQWTLIAPEGYTFDDPGIVFLPPPEGFTNWPGEPPVRDADKCQVRAKANKKVSEIERYRYDIFLCRPEGCGHRPIIVDPDMENQPEP